MRELGIDLGDAAAIPNVSQPVRACNVSSACLDATGEADQADGALSAAWDAGAGRIPHEEEVGVGWTRA